MKKSIRILSGHYKNRCLIFSPCAELRPTMHRVRKAVFDILLHRFCMPDKGLKGARIFDLFAGIGSYGFEALSRGAAHVIFVEKKRELIMGMKDFGCQLARTQDVTFVHGVLPDVLSCLSQQAHFAFLDPPYGMSIDALTALLCSLRKRLCGIGVLEWSQKISFPKNFEIILQRQIGSAWVTFFQ